MIAQHSKNDSPPQAAANASSGSSSTSTTTSPLTMKTSFNYNDPNIICTHDGVLLCKTNAEYINDVDTSGSLSLVEYIVNRQRRICIEWRPNENIYIAADNETQDDWALVDTIQRRTRTISETKVFNIKTTHDLNSSNGSTPSPPKPKVIRTLFTEIKVIEVRHRGQHLRLLKPDSSEHSEYFFQHGNAEQFVNGMRNIHIIDHIGNNRYGEVYNVLNTDKQKLKKTFAELDIGEIKASKIQNDSWLPNRFYDFLTSFPEYVVPGGPFNRSSPKSRPGALHQLGSPNNPAATDKYQIIGLSDDTSNSHSSSNSDKTPDSDLENVKEEDEKIINTLPERQITQRGLPLTETQWLEFHTPDGRISDPTRIKELIFRGGIVQSLRAEVWKYLLNYYQWNDTEVERLQRRQQKSSEYYNMKAQWLSMTPKQESNFSGYRERKCQIEKDVKRTDRSLEFFAGENNPNIETLQGLLMTYVMYNFDLGYVQGMSDLLAPIFAIQENEVDAFWCFVGFMDIVDDNFGIEQSGVKTQFAQLHRILEFSNPRLLKHIIQNEADNLYFCFRWLLIWYKREFSNSDILKLWECLWTRLPFPNFPLFISVAILDQETDIIIENKYDFTAILKHVNELSCNIDVKRTIEIAEAIYYQIKNADNLTNDIRVIIGEPIIESEDDQTIKIETVYEDGFDDVIRELSPEEFKRQQELLEEACQNSMYLNYM